MSRDSRRVGRRQHCARDQQPKVRSLCRRMIARWTSRKLDICTKRQAARADTGHGMDSSTALPCPYKDLTIIRRRHASQGPSASGRVCHGPRRRNCSCAPTYHNSLFQAVMLFKGSPPLPSLSLYPHRRSSLPSCSPSRNGLAIFSCPVCSCRHKPQVSPACSNTTGKAHLSGQYIS